MGQMLQDAFGRRIDYVRLSVTDRCDLRCQYCLPKSFKDYGEPEHWLNFDEIVRVVQVFAHLGVSRYRLTGGEPLLRRDLSVLVGRLKGIAGVADLSLSTNATRLAQQAESLREAGLSRLNVSLDSLCAERLAAIAGRAVLPDILQGLDAARQAGFSPIKINTVVLSDSNESEIEQLVDFCRGNNYVLRLIEPMPMGQAGRSVAAVDLQSLRKRLQIRFGLMDSVIPGGGPARYLGSADGRFSIGFITPLSQHFCASCNRVRLTVEGTLYLCLGQEDKLELRPLLRSGVSDEALATAIREAIWRKPERHEFREQPNKIVRIMAATGG